MVAHKGQKISFFDMAGNFGIAYNKAATTRRPIVDLEYVVNGRTTTKSLVMKTLWQLS
jgi:hypothetical protein